MVSLALTLCREGGDITPLKAGSAFANSAARAVVQGATLEQLEALGMFARCSEWQAAVLGRLSCSGVDEAGKVVTGGLGRLLQTPGGTFQSRLGHSVTERSYYLWSMLSDSRICWRDL